MTRFPFAAALAAVLLTSACAPRAMLPPPARLEATPALLDAPPEAVGLRADLAARLDSLLHAALADGVAPGAALIVGRHGRVVHQRGYGRIDTEPDAPVVDERTLFDLASLTKVVASTTAAMMLEEEGRLDLERTVASYLPEFNHPEKAGITVRMLLEHRGGMEAFAALFNEFRGREAYLQQINLRPLAHPPGTRTIYSDWDLILLQLILERLTGQTLDVFLQQRVFGPLGMTETGYNPPPELRPRIAATEVQPLRGGKVHGEVHDENAWALGGVAGHAGLFASARDLAVFAQMMLNGGEYNGVRVVKPTTVARWATRQGKDASRALGWDTPSPESSAGRYFSPRSFGHTGFTGTSIWIDPERGLFVVLLTNRVNPTRENRKVFPLRRAVADLVQESVLDAPLVDWEAAQR